MRVYSLVIIATLICAPARGSGTVENRQFFSPALGEDRWVQVYLPDGYDPEGTARYAVVYFLHGANGSHATYEFLPGILDNLIATQTIEPVIMVKPDGRGCPWPYFEGCGWVNSALQGAFEDYLVSDVIQFTDTEYRTMPTSRKRSIMGHSMGAFGAMHTALKHPDTYCAVAANSGYLYFDDLETIHLPQIIDEQTSQYGPPPWVGGWHPEWMLRGGWFMFAGGFSPHVGMPPYDVDFPLDEYGNIIPDVWTRWLEFDPARLVLNLTPETAPAVYFDCGTYDEFYLHPFNEDFHTHLTALGIQHEYQSYIGGHGSHMGIRSQIALVFLNGAMNEPSGLDDQRQARNLPHLRLLGSNPMTTNATFQLSLSVGSHVSLCIYDASGRVHTRLLNHDLEVGLHELQWVPLNAPAGMYFCRLNAGDGRQSLPLLLVR